MNKKEFFRVIKYFLVAGSAGIIQFGVCTLLDIWLIYWPSYLIALILSVIWNFTINRKVTFKSAGNIPKAMLKVIGYYCVYTPLSLLFSDWAIQYIPDILVTIINIIINGVTEYLFMRFFVFVREIDTAPSKKEEK